MFCKKIYLVSKYNHKNLNINVLILLRGPLDYFCDHECNTCGRTVGGFTMQALNKGLEDEVEQFKMGEESIQEVQNR